MKLSSAVAAASAAVVFHTAAARADDARDVPNTVTLHVANAPADLVVERWEGDWRAVCGGSCDRAVELDATYRTRAGHVASSKSFHLDGHPGDAVTITFEGRSRAAHRTGVVLTVFGATFVGLGAVSGVGALVALADTSGLGWGALVLGALGGAVSAGCTIVGLSTMIPGIAMMRHNGSSVVHGDDDAPRPVEPLRDAHAAPPVPAFSAIPILSGTF